MPGAGAHVDAGDAGDAVCLPRVPSRGGKRPSTIARALAGIADEHRHRGCTWVRGPSVIGDVMRGIRRRHGTAPEQKAALSDDDIEAMVAVLGEDLAGLRDRAILTMGWMGAFRRSELVALTVDDVGPAGEGLVVQVRRSKGDQEGRGAKKGIPTPPARGSVRCARSRRGSRQRASRRARSSARWAPTGACARTLSAIAAVGKENHDDEPTREISASRNRGDRREPSGSRARAPPGAGAWSS